MKITINEKEYGIIWGIAAIDRYCTLMDMEIEPAFDLLFKDEEKGIKQTIALAKFVSCAIESYSVVHGISDEASYEKILVEFDNQGLPLIQAILTDFLNSRLMGQTVSEFLNLVTVVEEGSPKKKATARKLSSQPTK